MDGNANAEAAAWVVKGEAMLIREEWEESVRAFERAFEISGRSDRDVLARLQKLNDYSNNPNRKITTRFWASLGMQTRRPLRMLSMTAHPDKGGSEAKMAQVNEAYEVLSNPNYANASTTVMTQMIQTGAPFTGYGSPFGGFNGGGDHPFAQFFRQAGQRGFSFGRGH